MSDEDSEDRPEEKIPPLSGRAMRLILTSEAAQQEKAGFLYKAAEKFRSLMTEEEYAAFLERYSSALGTDPNTAEKVIGMAPDYLEAAKKILATEVDEFKGYVAKDGAIDRSAAAASVGSAISGLEAQAGGAVQAANLIGSDTIASQTAEFEKIYANLIEQLRGAGEAAIGRLKVEPGSQEYQKAAAEINSTFSEAAKALDSARKKFAGSLEQRLAPARNKVGHLAEGAFDYVKEAQKLLDKVGGLSSYTGIAELSGGLASLGRSVAARAKQVSADVGKYSELLVEPLSKYRAGEEETLKGAAFDAMHRINLVPGKYKPAPKPEPKPAPAQPAQYAAAEASA